MYNIQTLSSEAKNLLNTKYSNIKSLAESNLSLYDKLESILAETEFTLKTDFGLEGFNFDVLNTIELSQDCEGSEHYLEDGTIVTDHLISKPCRLKLSGFKGLTENVFKKSAVNQVFNSISKKLGTINNYLPQLTGSTNQKIEEAYSQYQQIENTIDGISQSGKSLFDFLQDSTQGTAIEKSLKILQALQNSHTPFRVETKIGKLSINNMFIKNITAQSRYADHKDELVDFSITLQQMRFTRTNLITTQQANRKSNQPTAGEKSETIKKGSIAPVSTNKSGAKKVYEYLAKSRS